MRRKDRELKDMADIVAIAKRETVCTVAFHDESCPYLIPLNYGAEVEEGKLVLYFHGAKEGTKIDKIRENPQVSYCITPIFYKYNNILQSYNQTKLNFNLFLYYYKKAQLMPPLKK